MLTYCFYNKSSIKNYYLENPFRFCGLLIKTKYYIVMKTNLSLNEKCLKNRYL